MLHHSQLPRLAARAVAQPWRRAGRQLSTIVSTPHNFSPGPGPLPLPVLRRAQAELLDFDGTGHSVLCTTNLDANGPFHPGVATTPVQRMMVRTQHKLLALLGAPAESDGDYTVLFQHGGAFGQFSALPLNLGQATDGCAGPDYLHQGFWSGKAIEHAQQLAGGSVHVAATVTTAATPASEWNVRSDASYVHMCLNETVDGVEYLTDPQLPDGSPPLIADATSTLLSRPLDLSRYGLVYASGGKNLPFGMCSVVVRRDLLERAREHRAATTPSVLDYTLSAGSVPVQNMYNTPNTFSIRLLELMIDYINDEGGLPAMEETAITKSDMIYQALDAAPAGFYTVGAQPGSRSRMNACFRIGQPPDGGARHAEEHSAGGDTAGTASVQGDRELEAKFMEEAAKRGLHHCFGHPLRGGARVTMYIGVPLVSVQRMAEFIDDFARQHA